MDSQGTDVLRVRLSSMLAKKLEGLSPQFGKTVYVKMAYFLQEVYKVPLGYRFTLYTYGPYSPEVLYDLDRSRQSGWVDVEYLEDDLGFKITVGPTAIKEVNAFEPFKPYENQINEMVETFGKFRAKELELRATIVCVSRMNPSAGPETVDQTIEAVHQLKPHFHKSDIQQAFEELKSKGIITLVA